MKMGKAEAFKLALVQAAGIIESSDLEQLFGTERVEGNEDNLTDAQRKVVDALRQTARNLEKKGRRR